MAAIYRCCALHDQADKTIDLIAAGLRNNDYPPEQREFWKKALIDAVHNSAFAVEMSDGSLHVRKSPDAR